jgi:hypothetical protein
LTRIRAFCFIFVGDIGAWGAEMAKKATGTTKKAKPRKLRAWTKEDVRTLKTLAREKTRTTVIARKLKRSYAATRQKASTLGVTLGGGQGRKG